jgi:hypothetical protein
VRSAPPEIRLRPVSLDSHAFEDLARAHVKKLYVDFRMLLFVAGDEVVQEILAVRRVNEETVFITGTRTAREK